jgi:hypothetical protein
MRAHVDSFVHLHYYLIKEWVMCGRYRLSRRKQFIAEYFETDNEVDWEPRYNIAPS